MTLLNAVMSVLIFIGGYAAVVGCLYWLTRYVPADYRERAQLVAFLGPAILLLVAGLVYPAVRTVVLSFRGPQGDGPFSLDNYSSALTGEGFEVIRTTFMWVLLVPTVSTAVGLLVARFSDRRTGEASLKAAIFLPTAISFVGAGIIWRFVYAPDIGGRSIGLMNAVVGAFGGEPQYWLQMQPWNTFFLIIVMIWIQAGFATVVLSAAIKGVDDSILEAARIDGATERQVFTKVVLPSIRGTIVTVATTITIATLKIFDIVKTMTGGRFGTSVLANEMVTKSFTQRVPGYGAALAVIMFVAVLPILWVNSRNQRAQREAAA